MRHDVRKKTWLRVGPMDDEVSCGDRGTEQMLVGGAK